MSIALRLALAVFLASALFVTSCGKGLVSGGAPPGDLGVGGGNSCGAGSTPCSTGCADLLTNNNNCGTCGNVCPAGSSCVAGMCACQGGYALCGGQCIDTSQDALNCGMCATSCTLGQTCGAGSCSCPGGGMVCGGSCVDVTMNGQNCGDCGIACTTGQQCAAGMCQCTGTLVSCGGACTDTQGSNEHCGGCTMPCGTGLVCSLGQCKEDCDAGLTECPLGCADLNTSVQNCGSCGNACGADRECIGGMCECILPLIECGGTCIDPNTTENYCGNCTTACVVGQTCEGGICTCPGGGQLCDDECRDTTSNPASCGDCTTACTGGRNCVDSMCSCPGTQEFCAGSCVDTNTEEAHCGGCAQPCGPGATCTSGMCMGGAGGAGGGGGSAGTGGAGAGGGGAGGGGAGGSAGSGGSGVCEQGTTNTAWPTSCPAQQTCTAGAFQAPQGGGETGGTLRYESEHFAIYVHAPNPSAQCNQASPYQGANLSDSAIQQAANTLETLWDGYFSPPISFPEPYCSSATKWKAAIHFDDCFALSGGPWSRNGNTYMGAWMGPGATSDNWGLAHEFMHGVQGLTPAFGNECGGGACWIWESHANWMPHQVYRTNTHYCSDMFVNNPHLHYGSTRDRYCNWQFFEFLKDKHCYKTVHDIWTLSAPAGQRDPWRKLMLSLGWNIEQLNDLFGEWAMHNITWDYKNPPPTDGSNHGSIYRGAWGSIEDTQNASRPERRLRLTRLESLDASWAQNRRFVSPYYWAPQRWGYNIIKLHPEAGADNVRVVFRGVTQSGANSGWRWGLVATNSGLTTQRYSPMRSGSDAELDFCITPGENLYLVVVATPTQYMQIPWLTGASDGTPYPDIHRYPYMVQVEGAWPQGFQNGALEACPSGTQRHSNGNGCAPSGTPASVFVGPYARVLSGSTVSGNARIEDQATIINGSVTDNARVGAMTLLGMPGNTTQRTTVSNNAIAQATFLPLGWFGDNMAITNGARFLGDLEAYVGKSNTNTYYGLVNDSWAGVGPVTEVTVAPPYTWRP